VRLNGAQDARTARVCRARGSASAGSRGPQRGRAPVASPESVRGASAPLADPDQLPSQTALRGRRCRPRQRQASSAAVRPAASAASAAAMPRMAATASGWPLAAAGAEAARGRRAFRQGPRPRGVDRHRRHQPNTRSLAGLVHAAQRSNTPSICRTGHSQAQPRAKCSQHAAARAQQAARRPAVRPAPHGVRHAGAPGSMRTASTSTPRRCRPSMKSFFSTGRNRCARGGIRRQPRAPAAGA